jgi:hypothetical protein
MIFAIISILTILGILFRETAVRFLETQPKPAEGARLAFAFPAYFEWLGARTKSSLRVETAQKTWTAFEGWCAKYYPGWTKWLFAAFILSFAYLAASGLFFAVFISRGMYGFPLVGHVSLGGLFALLLAGLLMARARDYRFDKNEEAVFERFLCPIFKNIPRAFVRKILFWAFAVFGLLIILSALLSMLPILPADAQKTLLLIHKYTALGSVLAAIVFIDITFIPVPRP